jgi:hypothetical protein
VNDELQTFTTDKTDNKLDEGNTATATIDYVVTPGVQVKVKVVTTEGISTESTNFNLNGGGGGSIPVARTLTVTVSSGNGDVTKDPDQASYADGTPVTLEAIPDDGWSFHEWDGDLTGSVNPTTITMDGDKTVTATFTQNEYALTINTVGSGSVDKNPDQATYHLGDSVQLTANPEVGSTFSGWSGDLGGSTNPENLIIDADPEVTATFSQIQYQVTFQQSGLSGDASGTVLTVGSTTYTQNELPLTNIWVDDGTTFSYTDTVPVDATKQYVLTGVTGGLTSPIHASGTVTATYTTQTFGIDSSGSASSTTSRTVTVSSLNCGVNDVVIVLAASEGSNSISSVSGGGLTWQSRTSISQSSHSRVWEYYAIVTGSPLTSVTVTFGSSESNGLNVIVFGISGADTASPFDGSARTAYASSTSAPIVNGVSTSNANDMIIGLEGHRSTTDATAGSIAGSTGTLIRAQHAGSSGTAAEYRIVTATLSSQSVAFGTISTDNWAMIVEAVQRGW